MPFYVNYLNSYYNFHIFTSKMIVYLHEKCFTLLSKTLFTHRTGLIVYCVYKYRSEIHVRFKMKGKKSRQIFKLIMIKNITLPPVLTCGLNGKYASKTLLFILKYLWTLTTLFLVIVITIIFHKFLPFVSK